MTISDAIIAWLEEFNPTGLWSLSNVDTDRQSPRVASYALIKEPTDNIKKYLSGKEVHTAFYQLSARLEGQRNVDRKANGEWLEALEEWISKRNREKRFPTLDNNQTVSSIGVSSSFYVGQSHENEIVYSLTITITYS